MPAEEVQLDFDGLLVAFQERIVVSARQLVDLCAGRVLCRAHRGS